MKRFFLTGIGILLLSCPVFAKDMYITDSLKATFRTGPGNDHKIIKMVNSGEKLSVIQQDETWSKVQLEDGTQGWVLNQWITEAMPKAIQLAILQKKHQSLLARYTTLKQGSDAIEQENKSLKETLSITSKNESEISTSYQELKSNSAHYLKLKDEYAKMKESLDQKTLEADMLNEKMKQKHITWFLSGAGVLLLGLFLGYSSKKKKRNSLLD